MAFETAFYQFFRLFTHSPSRTDETYESFFFEGLHTRKVGSMGL